MNLPEEPSMSSQTAANGYTFGPAHEDRLQKVESGVSDLRVQVAELAVKQDFHAKINCDQNVEILAKIDELRRDSEHKIEKIEEKAEGLLRVPVKWLRKYFFHICIGIGGFVGHKGWLAIFEWLAHK